MENLQLAERDAGQKQKIIEDEIDRELGLKPGSGYIPGGSSHDQTAGSEQQTTIGKDLWRQLKRVSIPVFSGEKKHYENWKAAFNACIDCAPETPEYKLLQMRQGHSLKNVHPETPKM